MKRIITAGALMVLAFSAQAQFAGAGAEAGAAAGAQAGSEAQSGATAVIYQDNSVPETQTINSNINTSGTTKLKNVPTIYAPSIGVSAPCKVALTGSVGVAGFGAALGGSLNDEECQMREDVRVLAQMGEAVGALSLMCGKESVRAAMPAKCAEAQKASGVAQPAAQPAKKAEATSPQAALPVRDRSVQGWPVPQEVVDARPSHGRAVADSNGYLWTRLETKDGKSEWHVAQAQR